MQIDSGVLAELPRASATLNDHGRQVRYEGVLVRDVLVRCGIDFSKGLHGKQLSSYVSALAKDGYQVVYALAEFDPTISASDILLAEKREGKPLDANEGPLRIVVPQDKRPARCIRMLQELNIVQLGR